MVEKTKDKTKAVKTPEKVEKQKVSIPQKEKTPDEIKAEIAYEYQAEIDRLTRHVHDLEGMLVAANVSPPSEPEYVAFE